MVACQLCKLAYEKKHYRVANYREYFGQQECVANYARHLITNKQNDLNNVSSYEKRLKQLIDEKYTYRPIGEIL